MPLTLIPASASRPFLRSFAPNRTAEKKWLPAHNYIVDTPKRCRQLPHKTIKHRTHLLDGSCARNLHRHAATPVQTTQVVGLNYFGLFPKPAPLFRHVINTRESIKKAPERAVYTCVSGPFLNYRNLIGS